MQQPSSIGSLVLTFVIILAAIWTVSCVAVIWLFRRELRGEG